MRQSSEAATIEQALRGDAEAFGKLYERYVEDIYGYIYYRVGHTPMAEALTEQVFLKAWAALPTFRHAELPFLIWLYQIACSAVTDYGEKRKASSSFAYLTPVASGYTSPEEASSRPERVEQMQRAMGLLPAQEQDLLILRFVQGLNLNEVAWVLGRRPDVVRRLQWRALKALKALLEEGGLGGYLEDHG